MNNKYKDGKESTILCNLKKGQSGCIQNIYLDEGMKRRLQDIGLTKGTTVECVQRSPGGDPTAYLIRGAVMALRAEDASKVKITTKKGV